MSEDNVSQSSTQNGSRRSVRENNFPNPRNTGMSGHSGSPNSPPHSASSDHLDLRSTPQLDVPLAPESGAKSTYKESLRYFPNSGFLGESSTVGVSVPNTFKHKKHPNAKTKDRIGMAPVDESNDSVKDSANSQPVKTSTLKGLVQQGTQESSKHNETPSWMPQVLREEWSKGNATEFEDNAQPTNVPNLDFLGAPEANTFIHNPQNSQEQPVTPMWKRMSKDYMSNTRAEPLQSIFQSNDESKHSSNLHPSQSKSMSQLNVKNQNTSRNGNSAGFSYSSAFSTPVATKDGDIHLTQQQMNQLEDILEKAKDKPDDYEIKGSPLKLFGSDYDTFTKVFLSKFVDKVRSTTNSAQRTTRSVSISQAPVPKLEIQKFTKAGDYTDQDFMKNANNVFAHIQQRGYKPNHFSKGSDHSISFQRSIEHNTVTSTPKADKVNDIDVIAPLDEYSSFSTNFGDSSNDSQLHHDPKDSTNHQNDYTSFDRSLTSKSNPTHTESGADQPADNVSVYTFDDASESESNGPPSIPEEPTLEYDEPLENTKIRSHQGSDKLDVPIPPNQFSSSMSSVKRHSKDTDNRINSMERDFDFDDERIVPPIVWKRPSRLKLSKEQQRVMSNSNLGNQITKGTVKPGKFPEQYGDMIYDNRNNRWVSNDKENDYPGSLDSILDLPTESPLTQHEVEKDTKETSILKSSRKPSAKDRNLEVSFQIPDRSVESVREDHADPNVTKLSDMGEVTFSQTHKRLVSLVTGLADSHLWNEIAFIDLSGNQLENVEGLQNYLPNAKRLDLANNYIRYLKGLPSDCLELNVSQNSLDGMASFAEFHDLQVLDISANSFENLETLQGNIHMTRLDASNNMIRSMEGVKKLSGLTYLDLSQNGLGGEIDFSQYELPNLQELNLSENKIRSVIGIENLPNLRILNLNENNLTNLSCQGSHPHLKKLLLKFNRLRSLNLDSYPLLRTLRIDGNALSSISNLRKLKFLQEVSAKCQDKAEVAMNIFHGSLDAVTIDLSGNTFVSNMFQAANSGSITLDPFMNLNRLNLSAVGLTSIPDSFGEIYANVRELNLNFNKLTDISGLGKLRRLKSLNLLSNNIERIEMVLTSLNSSRRTLKVLDMRLNSMNFELYPYVFNPLEREATIEAGLQLKTGPIQLEALDDIENFSIHYNSLIKSKEEWQLRDEDFLRNLQARNGSNRVSERMNYEAILINFFTHMRELDGSTVTSSKRAQLLERIQERGSD
ncbi:hypothetical protein FT663_04666 [Candidozyma haemuli var. vulneris]|nr:hypothetical protein FT663_04666 [[Candida] haemuloni var. vulneris]KAF3989111.1 hypothetical protein FT662_03007 [[Candida] haemuloni var. vulneris]